MVELEVKTERDRQLWPEHREVVRVLYRPLGTRRWTRFVIVPDPGQSLDELERNAARAAEQHYARVGV